MNLKIKSIIELIKEVLSCNLTYFFIATLIGIYILFGISFVLGFIVLLYFIYRD